MGARGVGVASLGSRSDARAHRLQAEVQQNTFLRRLLGRAEQMRNAARGQAKEARLRLNAREVEMSQLRTEMDRTEAESLGLRKRIGAERARGRALESSLAGANVDMAEMHRRRVTAQQLLGMVLALLVVLVMRLVLGPRVGGLGAGAGGARTPPGGGGGAAGFNPRI